MGKQKAPPVGGYVAPGAQANGHWTQGAFGRSGPGAPGSEWATSTPAGPYQQAAEATAHGNRPTQITPFASSGWSQDPKTGEWTQNVGLNGPLAGAATSLEGQFADAWKSPLDNGAQARRHAEDAIYGRATSRLDPQWAQREEGMKAGLANQGLDPGSDAYRSGSDNFGRQRNDAYSSAMMDAIMGGGQEAQRTQSMDLQSRMAPLGALGGLQGLTQMPGFQGGPNYMLAAQLANQYGLDSTKMNNELFAALFGDILGGASKVGAAAAGA